MAERYTLHVNGSARAVTAEPDTPLLYVLRNDLELNERFACGLSQCGACTTTGEGLHATTVAAIANAIHHATGKRIRDLPFSAQRVKAAPA